MMKRLIFLPCIILMASGCVPKAHNFSLEQRTEEITKQQNTRVANKKVQEALAILQSYLTTQYAVPKAKAQLQAKKEREKTYAGCMVKAQTSFAVMLADIISIASVEALWGDLITINGNDEEPLKLPTTKNVVRTCLESKGFPQQK